MDTIAIIACCFLAGFMGAVAACIFWAHAQYQRDKREAKKLIARALGGSVVAETKPHRRTIRRK